MRISVREVNAADAEALAHLATQLGYPSQPEEMTRRLRALLPQQNQALVAVADADVVGWVQVDVHSTLLLDNVAELAGLVVEEKWRDKGIGRALLKAAEQWALERGCSTMYVRTNIIRHAAHTFYRHLGYQQVKTSLTFAKPLNGEG